MGAAFFDGDAPDSFYLSSQRTGAHACSAAVSNDDLLVKLPAATMEAQQISTANLVDDRARELKLASERKPIRKVTWADDLEKKAALPLVELIDAPTAKESSVARRVWKLSQDSEGTSEVQQAIQESSDGERLGLAFELRGHTMPTCEPRATKSDHDDATIRIEFHRA